MVNAEKRPERSGRFSKGEGFHQRSLSFCKANAINFGVRGHNTRSRKNDLKQCDETTENKVTKQRFATIDCDDPTSYNLMIYTAYNVTNDTLSRQTMSNWILKASEIYLTPVYEQLCRELVKRNVLHCDETTLQVLHEPGKASESKSYMWLYRTSGDTDKPIVLYEYQPGRGAKYPEEFLKDFKGYLHTDGYAVYHGLPEECRAHQRRTRDNETEKARSLSGELRD